jgi:hypothetical protein
MPTSTLPAFAYTVRGDTIVSLELTQIGIKKRAQNQIRFSSFANAGRDFCFCQFQEFLTFHNRSLYVDHHLSPIPVLVD